MDKINLEKLKWHSRRSILELDLYLDKFIKSDKFASLTEDELENYRQILDFEDTDLMLLFQKKITVSNDAIQSMIDKIIL